MLSGVHFQTWIINFETNYLTQTQVICELGIGRTFQIRPFKRLSILENAALAGYFGA